MKNIGEYIYIYIIIDVNNAILKHDVRDPIIGKPTS